MNKCGHGAPCLRRRVEVIVQMEAIVDVERNILCEFEWTPHLCRYRRLVLIWHL